MVILNTYPRTARRLLCQAYHLSKMYYPGYMWLLPGWFGDNWWWKEEEGNANDPDGVVCTQEEMSTMLNNTLGIMEVPSDYLRRNNQSEPVSQVGSLCYQCVTTNYCSNWMFCLCSPNLHMHNSLSVDSSHSTLLL